MKEFFPPGSRALAGLIGFLYAAPPAGWAAESSPDFTRDVRPVLSRHCFKCHGPDELARKSGLRLDLRESALGPAKSGHVAIVPGRPADSPLFQRVTSNDPDEVMPPPAAQSPLTAAEKGLLQRWIQAGAEYRPHWSFVPPKSPPLPAVKNTQWARQPIDLFILAKLEARNLAPSEPADRYSLARRVSLDLIGLPPTPEEAEAFVHDGSKNAYEHLVDTLLASPHYGERWARRWLDLARYADTNGYEKDRPRSIWPWRDWVINALNADLPFDQFTIEQLAGDLLPGATRDQRIATGFHRNTMLNEEGGIDPLEFRFNAITDRVNTTATTWLGLTLGCAQCHTHKYDPIPQTEYYQLMALLNNADEPDLDLPGAQAVEQHRKNLDRAQQLLEELPGKFPVDEVVWHTPKPISAVAAGGEIARILADGSVLFAGPVPDHDTYTLTLDSEQSEITTLRLEALTDAALPNQGPGRVQHGNFVLGEIEVTAAPLSTPEKSVPVKFSRASADVEQTSYPAAAAIDGKPETGWAVDVGGGQLNRPHTLTLTLAQPTGFSGGTRFVVTLQQQTVKQHLIGRPRLSLGTAPAATVALAQRRKELLERRFEAWQQSQRARVVSWQTLRPKQLKSSAPRLTLRPDDSILASGDITKSDTYELTFPPLPKGTTAIRLEVLPDDSLPGHGPGLGYYEGPKGDFFLGEFQLFAGGQPLKIASATHSYAKNNFGSTASATLAVDGDPQTGWSTADRPGERHEAVFVLAEPQGTSAGTGAEVQLKMLFGRHYACSLGCFRLSATTHVGGATATDLPLRIGQLLERPAGDWTPSERHLLLQQFLLTTPELASAVSEIRRLREPVSSPTTLVLQERPADFPRPTYRHHRGEYLQPKEAIEPGVLSAVAPFPAGQPRNRLGLARWLVSRENPLAARVTVNRQWQAFFGRGLVRTSDDFGFQGELPSLPELLDWLAVEFMDHGWSLKHLHKAIVLSAAYQQSSRVRPELRGVDLENRWLARGPRSRLEAELIRDALLKVSGLLSSKQGGPSVYPPQSAGVSDATFGGANWPTSTGEDRYRRSLYTFSKRTSPFALFNTFDAPTGESCLARRDVSNTALQALTLLNDGLMIDASRALGRILGAVPGSVEDRIRQGFQRCLTRPPTPEEIAALTAFFKTQQQRFASGELDAKAYCGETGTPLADQAAWIALARALLNLDEMITKS